MPAEFLPVQWDDILKDMCRQLVRLAIAEDLGQLGDRTTKALVADDRDGAAAVVTREAGIACGLQVADILLEETGASYQWKAKANDGDAVQPGDCLATIEGPAQELLSHERILLNFIGRLSGIATLTRRFVEQTDGTSARVFDTRKTTPGWRRLEKYAVRSGGGANHRHGLFDAVLIKDNHLAYAQQLEAALTPAAAVEQARQFHNSPMIVEVEVDTLDQLQHVMPAGPDIVLLDNMTCDELREAVRLRDRDAPAIQLEASGGVTFETIGAIAQTGVDRISVGALTHSARCLDVGLDWRS